MKRTNIYLSDKQLERLRKRAEHEQIPVAELVRRAIDTFLAWMTQRIPQCSCPKTRNGTLIPRMND